MEEVLGTPVEPNRLNIAAPTDSADVAAELDSLATGEAQAAHVDLKTENLTPMTTEASQQTQNETLMASGPDKYESQENQAMVGNEDGLENFVRPTTTTESQVRLPSDASSPARVTSSHTQDNVTGLPRDSRVESAHSPEHTIEEQTPVEQHWQIAADPSNEAPSPTLQQQELHFSVATRDSETTAQTAKIELIVGHASVAETSHYAAASQNTTMHNTNSAPATFEYGVLQTSVTNQVTDHIVSATRSSSDGQSQIEIVLDPPELGKVKIELTSRNDQLDARLVVSETATLDLIKDSLPRLFESLGEAGVSVDGFQLESSSSGDPKDQRDTTKSKSGQVQGETELNSSPRSQKSLSLNQSQIDILI